MSPHKICKIWVVIFFWGGVGPVCAWAALPRIDPSGQRIFLPSEKVESNDGLFRSGDNVALLLTPREQIATIGSEVILVATVIGQDRYTSTNERVEWSIAPGGVGEFVQVGKGSWIDLLLLDFTRPRKLSNTRAVTSTSRQQTRLTRGTPDPQDDVVIQPGQTWVSVSSPIEGTSYVSAYAPGVAGWAERRQTAVIHWVDAQWTFPSPAINPAGSRHVFTTTVVGRSDGRPRRGWLVRYEILDGPAAGFAPDGAKVVEVVTNETGQASVEMFQVQPSPGTNRIQIQILRPVAGGGPESPRLALATGITTKTWSAPQLAVRKIGPSFASVGSLIRYTLDVSNPGDLLAEGVRLMDQVPDGATFVESNPPGQVSGNVIQWDLGTLGPGQSRRVEVGVRADRPGVLTSCAEAVSARGLRARECATTTVSAAATTPAPGQAGVELRVFGPSQAAVGQQVRFDMVLTNRGPTAATGLVIRDRLGPGFRHESAPTGVIERALEDLTPGAERRFHIIIQVVQTGRVCHTVELYSGSQLLTRQEACVTVVGAVGGVSPGPPSGVSTTPPSAVPGPTTPSTPPATTPGGAPSGVAAPGAPLARGPALSVRSTPEPAKASVGQLVLVTTEIANTGTETLSGVRVRVEQDPQLRALKATEGFRREGNQLVLTIDQLRPGDRAVVQVQYECVQAGEKICSRTQVITLQEAQGSGEACVRVEPAAPDTGLRGPELVIAVTDLKDPVAVGDNVTYRISITNQGQRGDFQVVVAAALSKELVPNRIGTSGPAPCEIQDQVVRFAPVSQIRPGETLTYRIIATGRSAGEAEVVVQVQSQSLSEPKTATQKTRIYLKGS